MQILVHIVNTREGQFSNYSYIIEDVNNKSAILIDPSWDASVYEQFVRDNRLCLEAVLLTHSHKDHTNLAEYFAKKYNIPIYMSEAEIIEYGFCCENLHMVSDEQILLFKNISVSCMLLPGHTKGSMGYLIDDKLFVGDVIFYEGCGMCTYEDQSIKDMYKSIQRIINTCTEKHRIYPGHVYYKMVGQQLGDIKKDNICMLLSQEQFYVHQKDLQGRELPFTEQL